MNGPLTVGSLFSGIGGFDLGFERAGMSTAWFCEQDDYCTRVLERHWPGVPVFPDVHGINGDTPAVDVLCGGFPCQPVSVAGKGLAQADERWLWPEFARIIGDLRPKYAVMENVSALLGRGMGDILGDLAALGYDAEWSCVPASAFGAPHRRDRVWIVAYPCGQRLEGHGRTGGVEAEVTNLGGDGRGELVADPERKGPQGGTGRGVAGEGWSVIFPASFGEGNGREWATEPGVSRVADGVSHRVDRTKALGNALVPQIAEWIGRRIVSYEQAQPRQTAISGPSKELS